MSEDLDELIALADRIVVLHDGHVAGVVDVAGADRMAIGRLMLGGTDRRREPATDRGGGAR